MAKRKLTAEQKKAASERLAKAREARGHDGRMGVHESIRDTPKTITFTGRKSNSGLSPVSWNLKV